MLKSELYGEIPKYRESRRRRSMQPSYVLRFGVNSSPTSSDIYKNQVSPESRGSFLLVSRRAELRDVQDWIARVAPTGRECSKLGHFVAVTPCSGGAISCARTRAQVGSRVVASRCPPVVSRRVPPIPEIILRFILYTRLSRAELGRPIISDRDLGSIFDPARRIPRRSRGKGLPPLSLSLSSKFSRYDAPPFYLFVSSFCARIDEHRAERCSRSFLSTM